MTPDMLSPVAVAAMRAAMPATECDWCERAFDVAKPRYGERSQYCSKGCQELDEELEEAEMDEEGCAPCDPTPWCLLHGSQKDCTCGPDAEMN